MWRKFNQIVPGALVIGAMCLLCGLVLSSVATSKIPTPAGRSVAIFSRAAAPITPADLPSLPVVPNVPAGDVEAAELPSITSPEVSPPVSSPRTSQPKPTPKPAPSQTAKPVYKRVMTTVFWAGEDADASNDYIANDASAWDSHWATHYGGVDTPNSRCGYRPCGFTPKENPFYFALPYSEFTSRGMKASAKQVPWYAATKHRVSILKNHWIEVVYNKKVCYAQWEDVGPSESDDFAYVFGTARPKNTFGVRAGLDVSPALRDCLAMSTNVETEWRFIDANQVPGGPWKQIVTTSDARWE